MLTFGRHLLKRGSTSVYVLNFPHVFFVDIIGFTEKDTLVGDGHIAKNFLESVPKTNVIYCLHIGTSYGNETLKF